MDHIEINDIYQWVMPKTCRRETCVLLGATGIAVALLTRRFWSAPFSDADRLWRVLGEIGVVGTVGGVSAFCLPRILPKRALRQLDRGSVTLKAQIFIRAHNAELTIEDFAILSPRNVQHCLAGYSNDAFIRTVARLHQQSPSKFKSLYVDQKYEFKCRVENTLSLLLPDPSDASWKSNFAGLFGVVFYDQSPSIDWLLKLKREQLEAIPSSQWEAQFRNPGTISLKNDQIEAFCEVLSCAISTSSKITPLIAGLLPKTQLPIFRSMTTSLQKKLPPDKLGKICDEVIPLLIKNGQNVNAYDCDKDYVQKIKHLVTLHPPALFAVLTGLERQSNFPQKDRCMFLQMVLEGIDATQLDERTLIKLADPASWLIGSELERTLGQLEAGASALQRNDVISGSIAEGQKTLIDLLKKIREFHDSSRLWHWGKGLVHSIKKAVSSGTVLDDREKLLRDLGAVRSLNITAPEQRMNQYISSQQMQQYTKELGDWQPECLKIIAELEKINNPTLQAALEDFKEGFQKQFNRYSQRYESVQKKLKVFCDALQEAKRQFIECYIVLHQAYVPVKVVNERHLMLAINGLKERFDLYQDTDFALNIYQERMRELRSMRLVCEEHLNKIDLSSLTNLWDNQRYDESNASLMGEFYKQSSRYSMRGTHILTGWCDVLRSYQQSYERIYKVTFVKSLEQFSKQVQEIDTLEKYEKALLTFKPLQEGYLVIEKELKALRDQNSLLIKRFKYLEDEFEFMALTQQLEGLIEGSAVKPQVQKLASALEKVRDQKGWQRKQSEAAFIPANVAANNNDYRIAVRDVYTAAAETLMLVLGCGDYGTLNNQLTEVGLGIEDVMSVDLTNEVSIAKEKINSKESLKQAWLRRKLALIYTETELSRGVPEELKKRAKHSLREVGSYESMIESVRGDYGQILNQCGDENAQKAIVLSLIQNAPIQEVASKLKLNLADMVRSSLDDEDWLKYKVQFGEP
jgi:hypothetical protein